MPRPLGLWTAGAPIFWTVDLIAADADTDEGGGGVRWVVGEINCSCVGISELQSFACGAPASRRAAVTQASVDEGLRIAGVVGSSAVAAVLSRRGSAEPASSGTLACYTVKRDVDVR